MKHLGRGPWMSTDCVLDPIQVFVVFDEAEIGNDS